MLFPHRAVWSRSCLCTPRGTQALLSGYGGQDKPVRKAGEQEWSLPHDEVKAHFTPSVRQSKYYAFSRGTRPWSQRRWKPFTKWGPKGIITEKASVHKLSKVIHCSEPRSYHPALTIFQPHARPPCFISKMPWKGCFPSSPD